MTFTAKCTIEHGMIKLPPSLGLIDGMKVLVNIVPFSTKASKKAMLRELVGSWDADSSVKQIFADIDAERHTYFGRDIESKV